MSLRTLSLAVATDVVRRTRVTLGWFRMIRDRFLGRGASARTTTSPFGMVVQMAGASALLYGLYIYSPPLAFTLGGIGALLIGERL